MALFLARQPILDSTQELYGYELLFRSSPVNAFPKVDTTQASARVIHDLLHVFGYDALSAGKKLFVNVDEDVLLQGLPQLLPADRTVVELLETVKPTHDVVAACHALKQAGYMIALDDYVIGGPEMEPLLLMADVVKLDVRAIPPAGRAEVAARARSYGATLLAEKVETQQEQRETAELGCTLFQGYYFCKPELLAALDVPGNKLAYLRLIDAAGRNPLDFEQVETLIKQEPSLSVKLLRYLNSAAFGWRGKVTTLRQALARMGERPFRRWVSVLAFAQLGTGRPAELVRTALVRARFCELAAPDLGEELERFMMGLLSLLDALVGAPLHRLLEPLALADPIRSALLGRGGPYAALLHLGRAFEQADWAAVEKYSAELSAAPDVAATAWSDAQAWATTAVAVTA